MLSNLVCQYDKGMTNHLALSTQVSHSAENKSIFNLSIICQRTIFDQFANFSKLTDHPHLSEALPKGGQCHPTLLGSSVALIRKPPNVTVTFALDLNQPPKARVNGRLVVD